MKKPKPQRKRVRRRWKRARQLELRMHGHGGRRKGSGRKRRAPRPRVVHRTRPAIDRNHPVHVTIRMRAGVPRLRSRASMRTLVRVLQAARGRFDLRVIQFAVLGDHLHLLVEVEGRECLTRGMRGLGTRIAMNLNKLFERKGRLFDDRYHARALATPSEARRGLLYVLNNFRKHMRGTGRKIASCWLDPCSSARIFAGWSDPRVTLAPGLDLGTLAPRTWLLRDGWQLHGLLAPDELPGGAPRRRAMQGPPPQATPAAERRTAPPASREHSD